MNTYRLVYFGTPDIAVPTLRALAAMPDIEIPLVVTNCAKPVGRKKILTPSPVAVAAQELGLEVLEISTLKDDAVFEALSSLEADCFLALSFGHIFGKRYLSLPKYFLNLHGSLLPKYRGASPIQASLLHGDTVTGMCFMDIVAEMDAGGVYAQQELPIANDELFESLYERMGVCAAELCESSLISILSGDLPSIPQVTSQATYCSMISKEDGVFDPAQLKAQEVYNMWRAYHAWPRISFMHEEERITLDSLALSEVALSPGSFSIEKDIIHLGCQEGSISFSSIQIPGKPLMSCGDFLRGNPDFFA